MKMHQLSFISMFMLLGLVAEQVYANGFLSIDAPNHGLRNAEYTTTHLFIDEVAETTADVEIIYDLSQYTNITDVEIFSNVNRRELARIDKNQDGYADGIEPPDGSLITDSAEDIDPETGHYFIPINMALDTNNIYRLDINLFKTGVYRLTARFKSNDLIEENGYNADQWIWYGQRDHTLVVSPVDSRNLNIYELNVFTVDADGDDFIDRSTIEDLHDANFSMQSNPTNGNWNLDYVKNMGINCLWFQPIHPYGLDGREPNDGWGGSGAVYDPGSPYAVKNFFEVNELMSIQYHSTNSLIENRANAMLAWSNFVASADAKDIHIMLDAPFNHTAHDVELAQKGVELFQPDGEQWNSYDEIRNRVTQFFSSSANYGNRADSISDIAVAPDRYDFGKWNDVKDVFFGRYDSLVEYNDGQSGTEYESYKNENEWFDREDYDWINEDFILNGQTKNITKQVWEYFASYAVHWLEKTRDNGANRNSNSGDGNLNERYEWDKRGIDALRCDFGQGLPPRCWEYIINVVRSYKWNFIMMSESLDGESVTYRSSRHFDILNENIVFPFRSASTKYDYINIFEDRRNSYGQSLVLLNNTSHDEVNFSDPWEAVIRSAIAGSINGANMVFQGQELGISDVYGYDHYETNFGKQIPHFKRWNSMQPIWQDSDFGNNQLYNVYSGILNARKQSSALRSSNRYFLYGDGNNDKIFAVAKYAEENIDFDGNDVVICFVNIDRWNTQSDNYKISNDAAQIIGIEDDRLYNVKNISAYERSPDFLGRKNAFLWPNPISGADLKQNGFFVSLPPVPQDVSSWDSSPYEPQYLKFYDVTDGLSNTLTDVLITNHQIENNVVEINFTATPGYYYHVENSLDLSDGNWNAIQTNILAFQVSMEVTNNINSDAEFFRVRKSENEL